MATILQKVKLSLRISHTLLDDEITDYIASARQEMIRAGMDSTKAEGSEEIVETAIKTYVLAQYANSKDSERYNESFKYQLDNLRKTYPAEETSNV